MYDGNNESYWAEMSYYKYANQSQHDRLKYETEEEQDCYDIEEE